MVTLTRPPRTVGVSVEPRCNPVPHFQPAPPIRQGQTAVNLLTAADQLPPEVRDYDRWKSGLTWRSTVDVAVSVAGYCDAGEWDERTGSFPTPEFTPFTIRTVHGCEGQVDDGAYRREAFDALDDKAPWLIAREVWTGSQGQPGFQSAATDVGGGGNIRDVIAYLVANHQDATHGGRSIVHIPSVASGHTINLLDLQRVGDRIVDKSGTVYVFGPGYPNEPGDWGPLSDDEDPDSAAAAASGEVWVYVTGPIEVGRGPQNVLDTGMGVAARMNLFEVQVQEPVIARFDTAHVFAGLATLPAG